MKKIFQTIICLLILSHVFAQELTNIVYVDANNKITENVKDMRSFIVIKRLPTGSFERLNYGSHTPLQSVQTYSDSTLLVLQGKNLVYNSEGRLTVMGNYTNNKKEDTWYYYNDTFKVVKKEFYHEGILTGTEDPDTIKLSDTTKYKDEREAKYTGGEKAWRNYLFSTLDPNVAINSISGGKVLVAFTISKLGYAVDFYLRKSVEFVLDEEALRVLYKMPKWEPAFQNGRNVNAYRVQPITFVVSGN